MARRLGELAELVGGRVEGDAERAIEGIRSLERAGPRDLSFVTHARYRGDAAASRAGALLAAPGIRGLTEVGKDLLLVDDAYHALARLLGLFHPEARPAPGVHPTAVVGRGCQIHPEAYVGPYAVIGEGTAIGAGAAVHALAVVGRSCTVGPGAVLHPHVVLYDGCEVGPRSVLHAGAVLGSDGFGYAPHGGDQVKVPQVGRAVVEEDVEIGANTTIDRATLDETRIGAGSKIDNLVQVAHNVVLGRGCVLVSQVGIAGSTRLGDGVVMAGQAGAAGHLELGDHARVAAKSAVFKPVEAGATVAGIPAVEAAAWRRQQALLARLGDLVRRLRRLEHLVAGGREEG